MALPKINKDLTFELNLPISNKTIFLRPFTVKEQSILLIADETDDMSQIYLAIKQIINNCDIGNELEDLDELPIAELEYIFMYLRTISISDRIEISMRHPEGKNSNGQECNHKGDYFVFTNNIKIINDDFQTEVALDEEETKKLILKVPTNNTMQRVYSKTDEIKSTGNNDEEQEKEIEYNMVIQHIDMLIDGEEIYKKADYSYDEWKEFLGELYVDVYEKILDYFTKLPAIKYVDTYVCPMCQGEERIELEGLSDFL